MPGLRLLLLLALALVGAALVGGAVVLGPAGGVRPPSPALLTAAGTSAGLVLCLRSLTRR